MNKSDEKLILFFMKYPEKGLPSSEAKGQVKTRLAKELGEIATFELYKNFVLDLLSMLETLKIHLWICFYPESSQDKLVEWLGKQYCYVPQKGENLGQKYGAPAQLIRNCRPNRLNSIFRFFIKECSEDGIEKRVKPMCKKAEERLRGGVCRISKNHRKAKNVLEFKMIKW